MPLFRPTVVAVAAYFATGVVWLYRQRVLRYGLALAFGLVSLLVRVVLAQHPATTEAFYGRGLFVAVRWGFDAFLTTLPFPLVYALVVVLLVWLFTPSVAVFWRFLNVRQSGTARRGWVRNVPWHIGYTLGRGLAFAAMALGCFLWLWGYNYCRPKFEDMIPNTRPDSLSPALLRHEAVLATTEAANLRTLAGKAATPNAAWETDFANPAALHALERDIRANLCAVIAEYGYPTAGRVRVVAVHPFGVLLRFNTSGVYLPFVGEGHLDAGLHSLQIPYTLAHEMAHGYGFTDEGVCNFLAYLACKRSADVFVRYSGALAHWRYVFSALRPRDRANYLRLRAEIPVGMYEDLKAVRKNLDRYPSIMTALQTTTYDHFLRTQGVAEGTDSYFRVVGFVAKWREVSERATK